MSAVWSEEAASTVKNGTLIAATAGATAGATMAVLRNAPVGQYTLSMSINCAIFGATFFSIRETFLAYQRRKNPSFGLKDSQTRDADDLFSSAMAGGTTGSILSSLARGPKSILPGFVLFSLITTAGQAAYSFANHRRQLLILRSQSPQEDGGVSLPSHTLPPHETIGDGDETSAHGRRPPPASKEKNLWDLFQMPKWSPVRKLTDEEYKSILEARLRQLDEEVKMLDKELGLEENSGIGNGGKKGECAALVER
ncbi:hypothetical protein BC937DRAFT_86179 [Endogone sp. FLAS-F59071]|nr:hypothetical protein BC937DRAFT_86179 [Endogone sp. FLAS-F59071]|eukprot:RUS20206.1 hypothetical protein BC937DRAFT_86179 [Endogone sp. FLAS-F59071]